MVESLFGVRSFLNCWKSEGCIVSFHDTESGNWMLRRGFQLNQNWISGKVASCVETLVIPLEQSDRCLPLEVCPKIWVWSAIVLHRSSLTGICSLLRPGLV